jgi:hypothetical protein
MVTRDTPWPAGTPCWIDLGVTDIPKARDFYRALFGWDIQDSRLQHVPSRRQAGRRNWAKPGRYANFLDHLPGN